MLMPLIHPVFIPASKEILFKVITKSARRKVLSIFAWFDAAMKLRAKILI